MTRAPAAARIRLAVPWVRSRLVGAMSLARCLGSTGSGMAVSMWTITSGAAARTARWTAAGSRASAATTSASGSRAGVRARPVTWWPAAARTGTAWRPMTPVAPASRMRMAGTPLQRVACIRRTGTGRSRSPVRAFAQDRSAGYWCARPRSRRDGPAPHPRPASPTSSASHPPDRADLRPLRGGRRPGRSRGNPQPRGAAFCQGVPAGPTSRTKRPSSRSSVEMR
jgi:hypothetical protein